MITRTQKLLGTAELEDNVIFYLSELERGLADALHLLCKLIDIKDGCYWLACEHGIFNTYVGRNIFQLVSNDLDFPVNRKNKLTPRESSVGHGQGVIIYDCSSKCLTIKCICVKHELVCKSRCYGTNTICENNNFMLVSNLTEILFNIIYLIEYFIRYKLSLKRIKNYFCL